MDANRLRIVFGVCAGLIQAGLKVEQTTLKEIRRCPYLPGHDITDEEVAEVMAMTMEEISEKLSLNKSQFCGKV